MLTLPAATLMAQDKTPQKPNIVLIMCDDMGFSDLGCYGSEISTPNIDQMAHQGLRFTQFKNAGRSCPSRASLITGRYAHDAGMGWMAAVDEHRPGYRGQITKDIPTIAEVMKRNGYDTYMSGKWHLTVNEAYDKANGSYPNQRGFDKYYGSLHGGGSYYKPDPLYDNMKRIRTYADDYYYTTAITDSAVSFIDNHPADEPMFLYVAYYAPHLPLQAPEERIEACLDRYKVGYDVLRQQRFERLQQMGIIPKGMKLETFQREFGGKRPKWTDLSAEQQKKWEWDMATYAAMIEIMDDGVGEVVQAVRDKGMLDNTIFIFLSDNGSTMEGGFTKQLMADLSNTPYRSYKQWCYEGGISTPFILWYGNKKQNKQPDGLCRYPAHIIDILPTCIDWAGADKKEKKELQSLPGTSLIKLMKEKRYPQRDLYFEHQTSSAIISGKWKLVRENRNQNWELINLDKDPFETKDLSKQYPEVYKKLLAKWTDWAKTHKVFPLEDKPWTERINYYKGLNPIQDGRD